MKKKFATSLILILLIPLLSITLSTAKATEYLAYDAGSRIRSEDIPINYETFKQKESSSASYTASSLTILDTKTWLSLDDYNGYYFFDDYHLVAEGTFAQIWIQADMSWPAGDPRDYPTVTQAQVDYLLAEFDSNIYSTLNSYFATPDFHDGSASVTPDYYDASGRTVILVSNVRDENYYDSDYPIFIGGFYSPAFEGYFDRNVITIDTWNWENRVGPDGTHPYDYEGTIAHEYQHLIHDDIDPDETLWINEGMSDLAQYVCGYGHKASHLAYYMVYHRTPLTIWTGGLEDYGESYLLMLYLKENFGGDTFISALASNLLNGIASIEDQLTTDGYTATFDEVYRDWTIANYLDETSLTGISTAKLGYDGLDIPSADTWGYSIQWSVDNYYNSKNMGNLPLPRYWGGYKSGTVQYPIGSLLPYTPMYMTYQGFQPELDSTFRGVDTFGVTAYSGTYELWGGRGDLLFNTATTATSISLGSNPVLEFRTLYEIEELWDFAFVQISTDGGSTWTSLENANTTTTYDPDAIETVKNNVPGFTGSSDGWVLESFDLSAYSGNTVHIRFLYITDWATTEMGFYVDDIEISDDSGTLLSDDLESGPGNWVLDGFQLTDGIIQNDWELTYINPKYNRGKFSHYELSDSIITTSEGYQWNSTTLDTIMLNKDVVTIIVSNHLPENMPVPSEYLLLVSKGNAK